MTRATRRSSGPIRGTANGGIGTLQAYHVSEPNSSYAADYINPRSGLPSNYWASGWLQYLPNNYSVAVPQISFFGITALSGVDARQLADQAGIAQRNPQTVMVPPGVTKDPAPPPSGR